MDSQLWTSFAAVAKKEFVHARRDKRILRRLLFVQVLQLAILGFIDTTVHDLPMVVVDHDRSTESRELVAKVKATGTFAEKYVTNSQAQARDFIRQGRAAVALIIPPDYHYHRARGEASSALLLVDASDPVSSGQATASITGLAAQMNYESVGEPETGTTFNPHSILLFNPQGRTTNYLLPSLLALILSMAYPVLSAQGLIRERDGGNLERLLMTPFNLTGLMLGKLAPYFIIGLFNMLLFILVMRWGFQVPIHGDLGLLGLALVLYLLTILSLGTFIAAGAQSMPDVSARVTTLVTPSTFLSGYIFPLSSIPTVLLPVSYLLPATHMIEVMRGVVLRGAGFMDLLPQFMYLFCAPLVLTFLAARKFRQSVESM